MQEKQDISGADFCMFSHNQIIFNNHFNIPHSGLYLENLREFSKYR